MKNKHSGVAAVEMAIVAPLLFLIIFGIINYSFLLYNKAVITNAAREGARWASVRSSSTFGSSCPSPTAINTTDPCGIANSYASNYMISFASTKPVTTATWTRSDTNYSTGVLETMTVSYTYTGIGYLWENIIGTAGSLQARSSIYHE